MEPDTLQTVITQTGESFTVELLKLGLFAIFITAVIEVIKGISAKGLWGLIKEIVTSLWKQQPLSAEAVKVLNFAIALVYLRVFEYGVMMRLLKVQIDTDFAWWLDYLATASLLYMGAEWAFMQWRKLKVNLTNGTKANGTT